MSILVGDNVFFKRFAGKHICANMPYLFSIYVNIGNVIDILSEESGIVRVVWMSGLKVDHGMEDLVLPGSKEHNEINTLFLKLHNFKPGEMVQHKLVPKGSKQGKIIALDHNSTNIVVEWSDNARGVYKSEVLEAFSSKIDPNLLFRASKKTKTSYIPKFEMPKKDISWLKVARDEDDVPF